MSWGNVSLLELVWTSIAAGAFLLWLVLIGIALRDAAALRTRPNYDPRGARAEVVRGRLWAAILDAGIQGAIVLLGVSAMLTPPSLRSVNEAQATRGGLLLIVVELLLVTRAVVTLRARLRTNRALRRARAKEEQAK